MRFDIELRNDHLNGIVEIDGGWFGGYIGPKIIASLALIGVGANTKMASASALWSCVSVAADRDNRREA